MNILYFVVCIGIAAVHNASYHEEDKWLSMHEKSIKMQTLFDTLFQTSNFLLYPCMWAERNTEDSKTHYNIMQKNKSLCSHC